jgi:hypothetical protein
MSVSNRHRELVDGYCSGCLTDEEFSDLEDALGRSRELRKLFAEYRSLETAIRAAGGVSYSVEPPREVSASRSRFSNLALAAGLVFFLGACLTLWINHPNSDRDLSGFSASDESEEQMDDGIGQITQILNVVWTNPEDERKIGVISPGSLQFESGLIELEFFSGAKLILDGPADVELVSAEQMICRKGRLRGYAPPHARGFTILSPSVELVDLGTEFGMEISSEGEARVHVFDGEVELYRPDGKREAVGKKRLIAGDAVEVDSAGASRNIGNDSSVFPSFDRVQSEAGDAVRRKLDAWQQWKEELDLDPGVVVHYDFESPGTRLRAHGEDTRSYDGTIIGCEQARGRLPGKHGLDFKRLGDRVRVSIDGELEDLSFAAWIRVDALPQRRQALVMSDGFEPGHIHWQISHLGELRFGSRYLKKNKLAASGVGSPVVFGPREIGVWNFVAVTRRENIVTHYFNGVEVASAECAADKVLKIGAAEIGNWGKPLQRHKSAIRNFVGRVDDVIVWNRSLTPAEMQDIYERTRP